jgi:hypothetical protein
MSNNTITGWAVYGRTGSFFFFRTAAVNEKSSRLISVELCDSLNLWNFCSSHFSKEPAPFQPSRFCILSEHIHYNLWWRSFKMPVEPPPTPFCVCVCVCVTDCWIGFARRQPPGSSLEFCSCRLCWRSSDEAAQKKKWNWLIDKRNLISTAKSSALYNTYYLCCGWNWLMVDCVQVNIVYRDSTD